MWAMVALTTIQLRSWFTSLVLRPRVGSAVSGKLTGLRERVSGDGETRTRLHPYLGVVGGRDQSAPSGLVVGGDRDSICRGNKTLVVATGVRLLYHNDSPKNIHNMFVEHYK